MLKVPQGLRVHKAHKVFKEFKVLREVKEQPVLTGLKVFRESQALKGLLDLQAPKV